MDDDIFKGVGIEVSLKDPENFLKIKETLTRIGIASKKEKKLYQSCHILHKRGRYVILHFKELFSLDGKESNMTEDDVIRRDSIAILLEEWGLLLIEEETAIETADLKQIKIVPYKEKDEWALESKYSIGRKSK